MSKARTLADLGSGEVGDISSVTAGTGLSGGGTSGAVTVSIDSTVATLTDSQTLTNKTLTSPVLTTPSISTIDAKGDLLVGSADNTITRLAVGSNNQVLTADSAQASGVKWATPAAGGMTVIASGTLSGTSLTLSSIPSTYNELQLVFYGVTNSANVSMYCTLNANTTASGYPSRFMGYYNAAYYDAAFARANIALFELVNTIGCLGSDSNNVARLSIPAYAYSGRKLVVHDCSFTGTNGLFVTYTGITNAISTAAVSSIEISATSSWTGGTYVLYGVK
jgi:hypothetical protein